ncbi:MAG: flagellar M-ring protein FliF C-terminal domain-containing protein, partial [Candidatus Saccharimonadales bacterium]
ITTALLLVLVLISAGFLFTHQVSGGNAYLLDGQNFSSEELTAMQAAFGKAGLSSFEVEGNRIRVPRSQKAKYLGALADAEAMPAEFGSYMANAVNKPGPFTSKQQSEMMMKVALEQQLSKIIKEMKGIEKAAVIYAIDKKGGFQKESNTTASVSVKPLGSAPLAPGQIPAIRYLVARAIPGLAPDRVTIIDTNAGRAYNASGSDGAPDVLDDPYVSHRKHYQEEFESKVRQALSFVPGVIVTANVEIDRELRHSEQKRKIDPKSVPISISDENETNASDSGGAAGQPGLQAQQPRANSPAQLAQSGKSSHTDKEHTTHTERHEVSTDLTTTERAGLIPTQVTVAVGIPSSYLEHLWREQNPAPPGSPPAPIDKKALAKIEEAETTKIKDIASAVIPQFDLTTDTRPLITVKTFQPVPMGEIAEPAVSQLAAGWMVENWSTLGMVGLGLVSLMMLRSMARSGPGPAALPDLPLPPPETEQATESPAEEAEVKAPSRLKRRTGQGQSLRDELADLVREDPDMAANILRTWIGSAT